MTSRMTMPPASYVRIAPLTSIRFFAAVLVVVFHYGRSTWPFGEGFLHQVTACSGSAVAFFFFLSGYILAHVYHQADWSGSGILRRYYVSRLARIYPIYLTALALQFILGLQGYPLDRINVVDRAATLQVHALMLQAWLPDLVARLNVPGWSLSVEAGFYLFFPLIIQRVMKMKRTSLLPVFLGLFLGSQAVFLILRGMVWADSFHAYPQIHHALLYHPLVYYPVFVLGVLAYRLIQAIRAGGPARPGSAALATGAALLGIGLLSYWAGDILWYGIHVGLLSPLYGVLIYSLCEERNGLSRLLSWRVLTDLGEASYSVYILQMPVHSLLVRLWPAHLPPPGFYIYLVILVAISWLLYWFFETPVRRWIRERYG